MAHFGGSVLAEEPSIALFAEAEARMLARSQPRAPVPVLLLSGALGAGKTTVLNALLRNKLNLRITCLVNDIASLNVDAEMLVLRDEARDTLTLSNGCACHSLAGQFEEAVWTVLSEVEAADRTDYIVIETSGVAEPHALIQSLERRYGRMTRARLDAVAVVVDADVLSHQLLRVAGGAAAGGAAAGGAAAGGAAGEEAARGQLIRAAGTAFWRQLACAEVVLMTKVDLLAERGAEAALSALLGAAAPWARVSACVRGSVPPQLLLSLEYVSHAAGDAGMAGHEGRLLVSAGSYLSAADAPPEAAARQARLRATAAAGGGSLSVPEWAAGSGASPHGEVSSLVFTSEQPLHLAAFQELSPS